MTNKEIFNLYEVLVEISQDKDIKFNIQTTYSLAYNQHALEPFYKSILDVRNAVLKKYAQDADNKKIIPKDRLEEFQQEWDGFMETNVDIPLKRIKLNAFEGTMSVNLMSRLFPIIEQ